MIQMLITESNEICRLYIRDCAKNLAAYYTDERWTMILCAEYAQIYEYLEKRAVFDMICLDITIKGVLDLAEKIRAYCKHAILILIADKTITPECYLRPSIRAESLMLKPLTAEKIDRTLQEAFSLFAELYTDTEMEDVFIAENRDGHWRIPYTKILFFEAREKRIYLNTEEQEISFNGTIGMLEESLPDCFLRCHRSYIINKEKVMKIVRRENLIELYGHFSVPVSKSYRHIMREL